MDALLFVSGVISQTLRCYYHRGRNDSAANKDEHKEYFDKIIFLDSNEKNLIRMTAPIIANRSSETANKFYSIFFTRYPQYKELFSLHSSTSGDSPVYNEHMTAVTKCPIAYASNVQRNVSGSQIRAMAKTIITFLTSLFNETGSDYCNMIEKIANKHVSHHITHEMYPHLSECLLSAIYDILDEVALPRIRTVWNRAFWSLAQQLMQREDSIIAHSVTHNHGWVGFRPFITKKHIESESVCSIYLTPVDNQIPLPVFLPGQYVTIRIRSCENNIIYRNYSLSGPPGKEYFRISVKRIHGGEASCFIHDRLISGDIIDVSIPCGTFTLDPNMSPSTIPDEIIFISAGIGISPLISMLSSITDSYISHSFNAIDDIAQKSWNNCKILFLHAAKNKRHDAFTSYLHQVASLFPHNLSVHTVYSQPRPNIDLIGRDYDTAGHIDADLLQNLFLGKTNKSGGSKFIYISAPDLLSKEIIQFLTAKLGISPVCIQVERFAPGTFDLTVPNI